MFGQGALSDELLALRDDLSRLIHTGAESVYDSSKGQAEALAEQLKATLTELGETMSQEESELAKLVSARPMTSLISAFALGIVVGILVKRS